ncbi:hypothetical protein T265_03384 [Opisthorchis viverrini]|uniref:Uncharacterized protein n=1 Tax=Opisthorchis viverrini TaxID=6198 RepID=A0A075AHM0_OPIVI|nr:hypothetical protein T265_03384 [Opisthorchis viverrini]KER30119.1 hypothetical protein T265_03384 [Opisthorchis viverrini]
MDRRSGAEPQFDFVGKRITSQQQQQREQATRRVVLPYIPNIAELTTRLSAEKRNRRGDVEETDLQTEEQPKQNQEEQCGIQNQLQQLQPILRWTNWEEIMHRNKGTQHGHQET